MPAREAESPATVRTLNRPCHRVFLLLAGRTGKQNGGYTLIALSKPDLVIELFLNRKGLHSIYYGVALGQLNGRCVGLNGGAPVIGGTAGFVIKVTTHPLCNLFIVLYRREGRPVELHQATATPHLFFDNLHAVPHKQGMVALHSVTAIGYKHNSGGIV